MSGESRKAQFFDRVAGKGLWTEFRSDERPKLRRLLRHLALRPGMTILEPGCGTGRLTVELAETVGPAGRIVANDISSAMLRRARKRRLGRRVRWVQGPAESLQLPAESVDRIVCFQSFPHFDDRRKVLRQFRQMLRPEGRLAIVHFAGRKQINRIHAQCAAPINLDLIPSDGDMRRLIAACGFHIERFASKDDGYWLFARPTSPSCPRRAPTPAASRRP